MPQTTSRRNPIFLGSRHAPLFNRLFAKAIDLLLLAVIYFLGKEVWVPLGVLAAVVIAGIGDGLGTGQSIGKRITGLRVVEDQRGLPCSLWHSVLRNIPFMVAIPMVAFPLFWVFFLLLAIPLLVLELYLVAVLDSGIRLGDVLANTLVIEHLEDSLVAFR